jgi:hypothetical protein
MTMIDQNEVSSGRVHASWAWGRGRRKSKDQPHAKGRVQHGAAQPYRSVFYGGLRLGPGSGLVSTYIRNRPLGPRPPGRGLISQIGRLGSTMRGRWCKRIAGLAFRPLRHI